MLSHRRRLTLGTLALTSMLLSIVIQWQIIVGLGPGAMTDAYFASQVVPSVLMVIIGSSVSHVLVPFVIEMTPGERQVNTWGMLLALTIVMLFLDEAPLPRLIFVVIMVAAGMSPRKANSNREDS